MPSLDSEKLDQLSTLVSECLLQDRFPLRRRLRAAARSQRKRGGGAGNLDEIEAAIEASRATLARKRASRPLIEYPEDLPIAARREDIAAAIAGHQVVVVAGETGSGKTTQLPKICLELGRGIEGQIGHTQPRRLAARTVARRIAEELDSPLGAAVGYQVRFHEQVSAESHLKLMTDGILLAEMQRDRYLNRYDTLIIDEAHERSLNIDFLLGYLKQLLPRRPDLKLVITSATIDVERFSHHFDDAPVIEVSGRSYPVETRYRPLEGLSEDRDLAQGIEAAVQELLAEDRSGGGDILAFLSGEAEIRAVSRHFRDLKLPGLEVLPLYARLSAAEQNRIFNPARRGGRRLCLATNVAETSLTVPGIRYVVDPGTARISRYSYRTKVQRLPIEPISQASANQRQGRCGRVAAGICIRLYSEQDFDARPEFTDPEILRTNLAAVILQMLVLRLGSVEDFPFINPPDPRMVRAGYRMLEELGAVTGAGEITDLGSRMARLPVDPRLGRMVLAATDQACLAEILVIASALAIQDPRERPTDKRTQADQAHARFRHPRSDFMAWLALWRYYEEQRQALSENRLRKLCQREYLSYMRMREWRDVHYQLTLACRQQGIRVPAQLPEEENYQGVHTALLSGLLGNIAQLQEGTEYLGARSRKLHIFPGSSQFRKKPRWLVAGDIVETSRVYAREVGAIDPRWVLEVNPALLKHHYYEPRWQPRSGRAMALERITLFGLTLADKRAVHYGPINPAESRELLIREGLIAGRCPRPPGFLKHNARLVRELRDLESRTRRRDILADDQVLFEFYDERLPPEAYTLGRLQSWLKRKPEAASGLRIDRERLLARDPGGELGEQYPDQLVWRDMRFPLSYRFEPGGESDGVSVDVPVGLLNRVPRFRFEWLVPGLLREKCIQMVKALPKEQRRRLVPVPDFVDRALAELAPEDRSLAEALAETLSRLGGLKLGTADFNLHRLDDYYRMNVRVLDSEGRLLEQGRDLSALIEALRGDTRERIDEGAAAGPARSGITRWDVDEVPREWRFRQAGVDIQSFPALVDCGDSVAIELFDYPGQARLAHRLGVLRLLRLHSARQVKSLRQQLLRGNDYNLALAGAGLDRTVLLEDLADACYVQGAELDGELPYTRAAFESALQRARGAVGSIAVESEARLLSALTTLAEVRRILAGLGAGKYPDTRADIDTQLQGLLSEGFQRDTPGEWLSQYPRYMKALAHRVQRLSGQYAKDQKHGAMLGALAQPLQEAIAGRPGLLLLCEAAGRYRWMLEELRVSLFAQNLGTRTAVSEKRLRELWREVQAWLAENPL